MGTPADLGLAVEVATAALALALLGEAKGDQPIATSALQLMMEYYNSDLLLEGLQAGNRKDPRGDGFFAVAAETLIEVIGSSYEERRDASLRVAASLVRYIDLKDKEGSN
jgi:hypothetical protein